MQLNGGRFSIDAIELSSPFAEAIHDFYVLKLDERADGLNDERGERELAARTARARERRDRRARAAPAQALPRRGRAAQLRPLDWLRDGPPTRGDGLNTLLRRCLRAVLAQAAAGYLGGTASAAALTAFVDEIGDADDARELAGTWGSRTRSSRTSTCRPA